MLQHASSSFGFKLYIHGGHDGSRWLSDFHCLDLSALPTLLDGVEVPDVVVTDLTWSKMEGRSRVS